MTRYPHHVQSLRRINQDAMKYIQHSSSLAGSLRAQSAEQPVETIAVGELGAVGVISLDNGRQ